MLKSRIGSAALLALSCAALPSWGQAPAWPSKPVRVVIPVPPGGVQDLIARAVGEELTKIWGQAVLTENRAGAGGVNAAEAVAKAAPDGYTILMSDEVPLTITPLLQKKLPYDAENAFTPLLALVEASHVMVVPSALAVNSLQDLIALARARPDSLNYGSFGVGSTVHLNTEEFATLAGIRLTHVPYKGGADVLRAILAGDVQFAITGITPARPLLKQGKIRVLAYTGARREPTLPDIPTVAEAGVPGFQTRSTFGWIVPAGTPRAATERIAADAARVVASNAFHEKYLAGAGLEVANLGPDRYPQYLKETRARYAAQINRLQIKAE